MPRWRNVPKAEITILLLPSRSARRLSSPAGRRPARAGAVPRLVDRAPGRDRPPRRYGNSPGNAPPRRRPSSGWPAFRMFQGALHAVCRGGHLALQAPVAHGAWASGAPCSGMRKARMIKVRPTDTWGSVDSRAIIGPPGTRGHPSGCPAISRPSASKEPRIPAMDRRQAAANDAWAAPPLRRGASPPGPGRVLAGTSDSDAARRSAQPLAIPSSASHGDAQSCQPSTKPSNRLRGERRNAVGHILDALSAGRNRPQRRPLADPPPLTAATPVTPCARAPSPDAAGEERLQVTSAG